ncbi:MAG: hypothetical protein K6G29_01890 [Clostridiales bacterium]|nr:hypothetical protein [Clostridiales bacterium]
METKRNLKYFTAPPFNVGTIIGLVVAVLGLLYWIIFGGRRGGANTLVGVLLAIVGVAIMIFSSGGKSNDSDIDYQISERIKNLQELNEKKHEVFEKSFLKQRKPITLRGYDFEAKEEPFYYKKGADGINRTNYFIGANLIFTSEKVYLLGRRFSLLDETIDEELNGQWFYNELDKATVEEKEYEYKKGDRTLKAKYSVFQILKQDGDPILKMCVDQGADIDTYTDQITRVIATRQKELAKRAEETAQRRAQFRAKIAAEKAAEAAAAGETVEDAAEEAVETVADKAEKVVDTAAEAVDTAVDAVTDKAEDVAEAVDNAVDAVKDKAEEVTDAAAEAVDNAVDAVKDKAADVVDAAADKAEEVVADAADAITKKLDD